MIRLAKVLGLSSGQYLAENDSKKLLNNLGMLTPVELFRLRIDLREYKGLGGDLQF